jgi:hypothetical protein
MPLDMLSSLNLLAMSVLVVPGAKPVVLAQDREIIPQMEAGTDLAGSLSAGVPFDKAGYRIITRAVSTYQPDRLLYDCIALKLPNGQKK